MLALRRGLGLLSLAMVLSNPKYGDAFELFSVGVNATVGLDEPTRKLIENWAPKVRAEMLGLPKDALPLLERDINEYLSKVNSIVDRQIDHAQCAAGGAVGNIMDTFKKAVTGKEVFPISELRSARLKFIKPLGASAKPQSFADKYSELTYYVALTYCKAEISPATREDAAKLEGSYRRLHNAWERLDGECTGVEQCLATVLRQTEQLIGRSDQRDNELVKARERFTRV